SSRLRPPDLITVNPQRGVTWYGPRNERGGTLMSVKSSRVRAFAAPVFVGLLVLVGAACAPPPAPVPYYGITFNAPSLGYIGKTYPPTSTATSGLPVTLALDPSSTG